MAQTSYPSKFPVAVAGLHADNGGDYFIASKALEDSNAEFGLALVRSAVDLVNGVKVPTATAQEFLGITLRRHPMEDESVSDYKQSENVDLIRKGRVWVQTNEAVTPADDVYFVFSGADAGKFRSDATGADQITSGAKYADYDASTGLALLELNLPS